MKPDGITPETRQEWCELVLDFRDQMGSRRVMLDHDSRSAVLKGFSIAYLRMELPELEQERADLEFSSNVDEFMKREMLIAAAGKERP